MILRSDQPALYMSAVPAPAEFQTLRDYLEAAEVDVDRLCYLLDRFLEEPGHLPRADWETDPQADHQAWAYRTTVEEFRQMVWRRMEAGNGDDSPM